MDAGPAVKPVTWIGSSKADLADFPKEVIGAVGYALYHAQAGGKHPNAKPLYGFGGAGVLEIMEDHDGSTYRAIYTVRLAGYVYVLHSFQKKSKAGVKTPKAEIDLLKARLKRAEEHHTALLKQ